MRADIQARLQTPRHILLIKSHSMGVGDLLRSSAAWAALKARWPQVQLHLCMLSNHAGYVVQELISSHYLLASSHFVTVKEGRPGSAKQRRLPMDAIYGQMQTALQGQPLDLVIDCEVGGIRTALLARRMARAKSALAVGIAQFPLRRFFYDLSAPSSRAYQRLHGLPKPMDYTERDFVALAALGIVRAGTPITLRLSAKGLAWQAHNPLQTVAVRRLVVLNIGCGTEDALPKRPALAALVQALAALFARAPFDLHLSGAGFEAEVNGQFVQLFQAHLHTLGAACVVQDWAGQLSIEESAALLAQANLVVSSDSGPYHMAVALGVPTLCWFNFATPPSYHHQAGVRCLVQPDAAQFAGAAMDLLSSGSGE